MSSSSFSKPKPFSVVYLGEEHCDPPPFFFKFGNVPHTKKNEGNLLCTNPQLIVFVCVFKGNIVPFPLFPKF